MQSIADELDGMNLPRQASKYATLNDGLPGVASAALTSVELDFPTKFEPDVEPALRQGNWWAVHIFRDIPESTAER